MSDGMLAHRLIALPRSGKRLIVLAIDTALCVASVQVAFYLRLGEWQAIGSRPFYATIATIALSLPLFISFGLYRAIFRYAGLAAMVAIVRATVLFAVPFGAIFTFVGVAGVPRTVGIIEPLILFLFVAGSRALAHWLLNSPYRRLITQQSLPRAVIYGAGGAGRQLASAIAQSGELAVIGYLDDDPTLIGSTLNGLRIFGPANIASLIEQRGITEVLLAIPSAARTRRADIVASLTSRGVHVRTLPAMIDIARGKVTVADLKEVAIEDLLSRATIPPDQALLRRTVFGRTILVTGAGGSIGSELCRQIVAIAPTCVVLVDHSEYNLYSVTNELEAARVRSDLSFELVPLLASVRDEQRMREIFAAWQPATIYHAAAYKHVPLVEHNSNEGIANNVFGTLVVAKLAAEFFASNFILISSDKAVRPTNIMGATKRLAELIVQGLAAHSPDTCYCMVRFGNVLGSSGSVVPMFRQQIAAGGPVTITHPEMTRYFMTITEAAQLVIQAGAMAKGGDVFVLDMGEPVRIMDLARNMIHLSGLAVRDTDTAHGDIAIKVVGLRPGEKLYEELLIGNDPAASSHPRILTANERHIAWRVLEDRLAALDHALAANDVLAARRTLIALVPEFKPQSAPVDRVWLRRASDAASAQPVMRACHSPEPARQ